MSTVFVINSGSSSIKYQLINPALEGTDAVVASGMVDQIGLPQGKYSIKHDGEKIEHIAAIPDHSVGMQLVIDLFSEVGLDLDTQDVVAVGHRVVQGGNIFHEPVKIDDTVVEQIESLSPLAPLHNPAHVLGMKVARKLLPSVPHVAVFDTAFFSDLPDASRIYPIPQNVAEKYSVRRYGAHGTSHQYVSQQVPELLDRDPATLRQIILHLGNGASASAVKGGKPIDTSMGLTPLEGLVMGTRCGDIDASVVFHLMRQGGYTVDEMDTMFNRQSGVKAMIGSSDMRDLDDLMAAHDAVGQRCWNVYINRLKRYIGAYMVELGGVDVIVFTAGIGENSPEIREDCLAGLEELGIEIDKDSNNHHFRKPSIISTPESKVTVMVVPTNEELAISRQAIQFAE
ncbi:acetate/propionate family kinase [Lawsonella clevelandensis]|uniref:Acetate kinase n=1 Tax=Lawsonella clevelandensis TaxID=1528099 RepID=A0A0M3TBM6_9ACTN|nr:acetate kinase [Lawsonella clevelandensis]ALE18884.1 acetate kinase [Lawsonella clevelandensis]ALE34558.1 acetate kinase [Lawsonella clevelandensis]MDU7193460.1 acetate kinase [Lawsonella clevelandensis]VHO00376.1 Acetate kinase [Lawsonella clevelandensis]